MPRLLSSQSAPELESVEYTAGLVQRSRVRQATLACLAEGQLDAFMYPSVRRVAAPIGEDQPGTNCRLSANSGLPAISVPGGFTEPGMHVGVELLGAAWSETAARSRLFI